MKLREKKKRREKSFSKVQKNSIRKFSFVGEKELQFAEERKKSSRNRIRDKKEWEISGSLRNKENQPILDQEIVTGKGRGNAVRVRHMMA